MQKILITGGKLVTEKGLVRSDVLIDITGTIDDIKPSIKDHKNATIIDATGKLLFPLLIDCHVHFREPGLEHKGTMLTESASALAGGVGTVCEMPNTIPPTVTVSALADKVRRAELVQGVTLKFFFGITEVIHLQALRDLWTGSSLELKRLKRHCAGVKLFFDHSTGDQKVDGGIIDDIFRTCAELKIPLVAHCEDADINDAQSSSLKAQSSSDISLHSSMRPPESEAKAIAEAIGFAEKHGTHLHIAHLSTKQGIDLVRTAKKKNVAVTCEVTPHHLFLTTDDYASLGTFAKMNPPLRSSEHQQALWNGISDGTVDCISTDHAPHTIEEKKTGEPLKAPSGVPGVETMLPLLLTVVSGHSPHPSSDLKPQTSNLSYPDILRLCFTNPNRIFSLHQESIAVKAKARIAIVDPAKEWLIQGENLHSKCGWTPYEGWTVHGSTIAVIQ
jgi:dihydroorotase